MQSWYLAYTKPRCEDIVAGRFLEHGLGVLNPKLRERKLIRRKVQVRQSPLFPCYVFVRFECPRDFRFVKYCGGVRGIVGADFMPAIVPDGIISGIEARQASGAVDILPDRFMEGQEVKVKAGAFEGFNAIFERELRGSERVSILLKAMNVRVVIDSALLEKVA